MLLTKMLLVTGVVATAALSSPPPAAGARPPQESSSAFAGNTLRQIERRPVRERASSAPHATWDEPSGSKPNAVVLEPGARLGLRRGCHRRDLRNRGRQIAVSRTGSGGSWTRLPFCCPSPIRR